MITRNKHWFKFVSNAILALFLGILVLVITIAYTRPSGSTGLDMATMHKMRHEAKPPSPNHPTP